MGEKLDAQVAQGALGHVDHDAGVEPCGQHADGVDAADAHQCTCQRAEVRRGLPGHGDDVIIDQGLEEEACLHVCQRADDDADQHKDAVGQIVLEHLIHDPLEQLARILNLRLGAAHPTGAGALHFFHLCHYCSPPCLSKSPPPWVWLL